jgi:hypothetical protein
MYLASLAKALAARATIKGVLCAFKSIFRNFGFAFPRCLE